MFMRKTMGLFGGMAFALAAAGATRTYTSAQTVSDVLTGDDDVVVDCGAGRFVTFTGANAFTGGVTVKSGGVVVSNATALGTGPVKCASGTAVRVCVSYRGTAQTLNKAVIDRIEVDAAADGADEPYVAFQLTGGGLANDVDFSRQPHLWLSAPVANATAYLNGRFDPYGNVYKFGYSGEADWYVRGIAVTNLTDAADGTSRRVLLRGTGTTSFASGASFTGGVLVEGPARIALWNGNALGTGVTNRPNDFLTLRNGAGLNVKNPSVSLPSTLGLRFEGTNDLHSCGASRTVHTTVKGPVSGWGEIRFTDQGGVWFTSASNTFTGALRVTNIHSVYDVEIRIGDGANCSWAGSEIIQHVDLYNQVFSVNCDSDFTLDTALSATGGRVTKFGRGTLTFARPFNRQPFAAAPDRSVLRIAGGTVKLDHPWNVVREGAIELENGGTLDLNGTASTRIPLPYGNGAVVGIPDGGVTFTGATWADASFNGRLAGDVTVDVASGTGWRLGPDTDVEGSLNVAVGRVELAEGVHVAGDYVSSATARMSFLGRDDAQTVGLGLSAWYDISSADSMDTMMQNAIDHAATTSPDFVGDMAAFTEGFKSGTNDSAGGNKGPLVDTIGGSKDNFLVKFQGSFIADTDGTYAFRLCADDAARLVMDGTNVVVGVAAGSASTTASGTVELTSGHHPLTVWFCEKGGWEIIKVEMKAPGETEWSVVPLRVLSAWNGRHTELRRVTGAGTLELGSATAVWPATMDLADFSGGLLANAHSAAPSVGRVVPTTASVFFLSPNGLFGADWTMKGQATAVFDAAGAAVDLLPSARDKAYGSLNTAAPLDLSRPFTFAFDYSIHEPWGMLGDGFCLVLHDGTKGYANGTFSNGETGNRINEPSAYGMQCYLMPWQSIFSWIKNCKGLGVPVTNTVFTMENIRRTPLHVECAWDLKNLVVRLNMGTSTWVSTNALAAADLAEKFPSGAHLGVWGQCGGYYTGMRLDNVRLDVSGAVAGETPVCTFNGVLGVTNGVSDVRVDAGVAAELAAELDVVGAGGLAVADGSSVALTSPVWTFDLANPESCLSLAGAFTFPDAAKRKIVVELRGEPTPRTRILADLTGLAAGAATVPAFRFAAGAATVPAFRLGDGYPSSYRLVYENGFLRISNAVGTLLIFR